MAISPPPPAGRTGPLLSRIRSLEARARLPAVVEFIEEIDSACETLYPAARRLPEAVRRREPELEDLALSVRQQWLGARPEVLRLAKSRAAGLEEAAHALEDRLRREYPDLWHAPPGIRLPPPLEALFAEPEAAAAAVENAVLREARERAAEVLALRARLDRLDEARDSGPRG